MKSLIDLNPKPQGGEWYSVLYGEKGTVKMIVLIDKKNPNLALSTRGGYFGIGNFFNPTLLSFEEANEHLTKEIGDLELAVVSKSLENLKNVVISNMKDFQKEYF